MRRPLVDGVLVSQQGRACPEPGHDHLATTTESGVFMKGKTVFITGGAGGLGASAVRYLAERSWQVFAADSDETALRGIAGEPNVTAVRLDVTDPGSSTSRASSRWAR